MKMNSRPWTIIQRGTALLTIFEDIELPWWRRRSSKHHDHQFPLLERARTRFHLYSRTTSSFPGGTAFSSSTDAFSSTATPNACTSSSSASPTAGGGHMALSAIHTDALMQKPSGHER